MVRDAYSASVQPQQADTSTANLTQELAQLLAQSIAQGQSGRRPPGAAATGSELASLAALVSASQNQRGQPFKDGLSSLSYNRPSHVPILAPVSAPAAPGLLVTEPHHEDEPMPIPSTWRQPAVSDDDRWYRQQLGAAALGLIAGLIVVVPAVLWLSGYLGGPQAKATRSQTAEAAPVKMAPVKTVPTAQATPPAKETAYAVAAIDAYPAKAESAAPMERVVVTPKVDPPARSRTADLMAEAKRLIESNDVRRARDVLEAAETKASAPMTFMLAETYDPNMLASWQTKGITANPEKARSLYQRARDLGDSRAAQRLDWLTAN
jgi:hypothetical protein